MFADESRFAVHEALPGTPALGDEGAANHTRFCAAYGDPGVEFFVYGRSEYRRGPEPVRYPARQTFEASRLLDEASLVASERADDFLALNTRILRARMYVAGNRPDEALGILEAVDNPPKSRATTSRVVPR